MKREYKVAKVLGKDRISWYVLDISKNCFIAEAFSRREAYLISRALYLYCSMPINKGE